MKKGWKIFWIICGISFGIGVICLVAGVAMGANRYLINDKLPSWISIGDGKEYIINEIEKELKIGETIPSSQDMIYEGIREIEVEGEALELQVAVSEDDKVRVEFENEGVAKQVRCYQENAELVIESEYKWLADSVGTVWLYVPNTQLENVDIHTDAGSIYVEKICAAQLDISVDAGEAVVDVFEAKTAEFECGAGHIEANGTVEYKLSVDCGAGEMEFGLSGTKEDYDYEVECGIGSIIIGDEEFGGVSNRRSHSHGAAKRMELECGVGSIVVNFN